MNIYRPNDGCGGCDPCGKYPPCCPVPGPQGHNCSYIHQIDDHKSNWNRELI